jgi:Zn-dependent protease with chaperone function
MLKHAGAAIAACLYVALSAWLVEAVGKAHRDALKAAVAEASAKAASSTGAATAEQPPPPRSAEPVLSPAPAPPRSPGPQARAMPAPAPSAVPTPPPENGAAPPAPAAAPATGTVAKPRPAEPAVARGVSPSLEAIHPFFASPQAKRVWALPLTAGQEAELGRDLNQMVEVFNRRLPVGKLERRVRDEADPLLQAVSRKDIRYIFRILDSKVINAFSHPGGYVYVTSGLLDWISEDEDYVLQFALAHEIYHVDRGHALSCLQNPGLRQLPYGTLTLFYLFIFPRGYWPEEMDFEADAWAIRQLQARGFTRRECLKFLQKLDRYEEDEGSIEGHQPPVSGKDASLLDNHYRAHPAARERLKRAKALFPEPPGKAG